MLNNRVALVTGCNRGIGRAVAERLSCEGSIVYAVARDQGCIDDLQRPYDSGGMIIPLYFDVRDTEAVNTAFIKIKKEQGQLHCLVNNAGILVDTILTMLDRTTLREIYDVNVFSVFEMMSYAARIMTRQGFGSIINIASICGDEGGMRGQTAYSSSKGAIIALTKTAAKELGPFGVRVNSISPGFIDTDMFRSGPEHIQRRLVEGVYLKARVGTPDEVAKVCQFLASDLSSYVNGENIRVDGFSHI